MKRRQISYKESCERECAHKLVPCGGPTVHGLEGYICKNCATFLAEQIASGNNLSNEPCSYCGKEPSYNTVGNYYVCQACAHNAKQMVCSWKEEE